MAKTKKKRRSSAYVQIEKACKERGISVSEMARRAGVQRHIIDYIRRTGNMKEETHRSIWRVLS